MMHITKVQTKRFQMFSRSLSVMTGVAALTAATSLCNASSQGIGDGLLATEVAQAFGLTAEVLACVDIHGSEPATVYSRLAENYSTFQQFKSLLQQVLEQQNIAVSAQAVLRVVANDATAQATLDNALVQIALLSNQAEELRIQIVSTALDGLADNSMIGEVVHAGGLFASLPPQYRMAVESDDEVNKLNWALRMQERAEASGGSLHPEAQDLLSQAHTHADVQSGMVRTQTYAESNQASIRQWTLAN